MRRVLERGQIEAGAERPPRIRLPDPARLFAARAARFRALAREGAIGSSIADYLHLMAALADAQHAALDAIGPSMLHLDEGSVDGGTRLPSVVGPYAPIFRDVLGLLVRALAVRGDLPRSTREALERLENASANALERYADALLARRDDQIDPATAPFVMAALQVPYAAAAAGLSPSDVESRIGAGEGCPACGTLPGASVVREDAISRGQRHPHCPVCPTGLHLLRITCSHCRSVQGLSYLSLDGGPDAIRAECCDRCKSYRKILYQETDADVDPVADDLASLTLDVLLADEGYHRASGHPLLWNGR